MSRRSDQPRRQRGTRLGYEPVVQAGWSEYGPRSVERHAREVHYDVLRREGFDAERAREISARSAEHQERLSDEMRARKSAEGTERQAQRLASLLPDAFLTEEQRAERAREIAAREARLASDGS